MVLHVCDVCGYQTKLRSSLVLHKNRRFPCQPSDRQANGQASGQDSSARVAGKKEKEDETVIDKGEEPKREDDSYLTERINTLEKFFLEKLDTLGGKLDTLKEKVENLNGKLETVNGRITSLEKSFTSEFKGGNKGQDSQQTKTLEKKVGDLSERLDNVEEDCLRLQGEFEDLESKIEK
jgi:uncharacterized phage infection (PIP) family protein YhgE